MNPSEIQIQIPNIHSNNQNYVRIIPRPTLTTNSINLNFKYLVQRKEEISVLCISPHIIRQLLKWSFETYKESFNFRMFTRVLSLIFIIFNIVWLSIYYKYHYTAFYLMMIITTVFSALYTFNSLFCNIFINQGLREGWSDCMCFLLYIIPAAMILVTIPFAIINEELPKNDKIILVVLFCFLASFTIHGLIFLWFIAIIVAALIEFIIRIFICKLSPLCEAPVGPAFHSVSTKAKHIKYKQIKNMNLSCLYCMKNFSSEDNIILLNCEYNKQSLHYFHYGCVKIFLSSYPLTTPVCNNKISVNCH